MRKAARKAAFCIFKEKMRGTPILYVNDSTRNAPNWIQVLYVEDLPKPVDHRVTFFAKADISADDLIIRLLWRKQPCQMKFERPGSEELVFSGHFEEITQVGSNQAIHAYHCVFLFEELPKRL